MKTLQLSDQQAREIYPDAPAALKSILETNWSKEFFSQKPIDRVKGVLDALAENGETVESFNIRTQYDTDRQKAGKEIEAFAQAINPKGWKENYDGSQPNWRPWFRNDGSEGFRFRYSFDCLYFSIAGGGSAFATKELSDHAANQIPDVYKRWML